MSIRRRRCCFKLVYLYRLNETHRHGTAARIKIYFAQHKYFKFNSKKLYLYEKRLV